MYKITTLVFLLFFSLYSYAQKSFDYEKNREKLIDRSIEGLSEESVIDNWLFEFSSHDEKILKMILGNNIEKRYLLQLDTIYFNQEDSLSHLKGIYIAECKDISGVHYKTKEELKQRVDELVDAFKGFPLKLIGIGNEVIKYEKIKRVPNTQSSLSVTIFDDHNKPIPFVSVGIIGTQYSTISDQEGNFRLRLPVVKDEKMLVTFRHLGYKEHKILLSELLNQKEITLLPNEELLGEVLVLDDLGNVKRKTLGDKGKTSRFGSCVGKNEGAEIAKRFDVKGNKVYLNKVGVFISNYFENDFTLLLNIYEEDTLTGLPSKSLLSKQVIVNSNLKRGWLEVNMNEYNITTNKPFYVAFQWTSNNTLVPTIGMSGKKGVTRTSSFDEWKDSGEFRWMMNAEVTYFEKEL